jgi:hypothetical protein
LQNTPTLKPIFFSTQNWIVFGSYCIYVILKTLDDSEGLAFHRSMVGVNDLFLEYSDIIDFHGFEISMFAMMNLVDVVYELQRLTSMLPAIS